VDLACGDGRGTLPLCRHFESVIGVDASEAQIGLARRKVGQGHIRGQDNVTFRVGDAGDLSFLADNSVDLITVANALHWFHVHTFSVECRRVLRPGGVLAAYSCTSGNYSLAGSESVDETMQKNVNFIYGFRDSHTVHLVDKYSRLFSVFQEHFSHTKREDSINMVTKYSLEEMQGFLKALPMHEKMRVSCPDTPDPVNAIRDYLLQVYKNNPPEHAVTCEEEVFIILAKK